MVDSVDGTGVGRQAVARAHHGRVCQHDRLRLVVRDRCDGGLHTPLIVIYGCLDRIGTGSPAVAIVEDELGAEAVGEASGVAIRRRVELQVDHGCRR